jgi:hypothetical protein
MRRLLATLLVVGACAETVPDKVVLKPEAEAVEVMTDKPSPDQYVALGEVTGTAQAGDKESAIAQAKNELRNQAAARGGSVVSVDTIDPKHEWQGRKIVVKLTGTAYKPKE